MRQRENRPDLLRVSVDSSVNGPVGATIDPNIVTGAVQLQSLLPGVERFTLPPG